MKNDDGFLKILKIHHLLNIPIQNKVCAYLKKYSIISLSTYCLILITLLSQCTLNIIFFPRKRCN